MGRYVRNYRRTLRGLSRNLETRKVKPSGVTQAHLDALGNSITTAVKAIKALQSDYKSLRAAFEGSVSNR